MTAAAALLAPANAPVEEVGRVLASGDEDGAIRLTLFGDRRRTLKRLLRDVERDVITRVLMQVGGSRVRACDVLEISREGLYKKMRAYGLIGATGDRR